jgi:Flp pilus assembly protein TadD
MSKVCFVISPIGGEDTDTRKNADDLYDLIVEPALGRFGFDVVRADKIPGSSSITNDIVDLIQNSELCVIDLTAQNANVYDECGRRHETGKPFVQLVRKGERLPFDLAGIRTIFYQLETPHQVHDAQKELVRYVEEFEAQGYGNVSTGVSIATLASAIDRLERKLDGISRSPSVTRIEHTGGIEELLRSPQQAFMTAVASGDLPRIELLLPRMRRDTPTDDYVMAASLLASAGSKVGAEALKELLGDKDVTADHVKAVVAGLIRYHTRNGTLEGELDLLKNYVEKWAGDPRMAEDGEARAFLWNQLGMMYHAVGKFEEASAATQRAIDLTPAELAFETNLSLILEAWGKPEEALAVVQRYMAKPGAWEFSNGLSQAVDVYAASGKMADAKAAYDALCRVAPEEGRLKALLNPEIANYLI